ncbi:MAG TPA: GNAT family protein [Streptosporangiaceae bacterium]|nr:GNAT family protein [Streptosporangiaceae bacterium]
MTYQWWPLFDLRLAGPALTLRPMREADLDLLSAELPPDLEMNPARTRFDLLGERVGRGASRHQEYWKAYGNWRPQEWRLNFVVTVREAGAGSGLAGSGPGSGAGSGLGSGLGSGVGSGLAGQVIGVQELEGVDNYLTLRTVDTSSYLIKSARGQGHGKEMRRAVLALAFGPLGAQAAITSAWHDNAASLGVSAALGYRPNGETRHEREPLTGTGDPAQTWADVMVHLRMKREEWLASGQAADIEITGFDPCRPLFGLPPA